MASINYVITELNSGELMIIALQLHLVYHVYLTAPSIIIMTISLSNLVRTLLLLIIMTVSLMNIIFILVISAQIQMKQENLSNTAVNSCYNLNLVRVASLYRLMKQLNLWAFSIDRARGRRGGSHIRRKIPVININRVVHLEQPVTADFRPQTLTQVHYSCQDGLPSPPIKVELPNIFLSNTQS